MSTSVSMSALSESSEALMLPAIGRQPGPPVPTPKKARPKAAAPAAPAVPSAAMPVRKRRRPGVGAWMRRGRTKKAAIVSTTIRPIASTSPPIAFGAPGARLWIASPNGKALGARPMKES